jgi:hypothetical protein
MDLEAKIAKLKKLGYKVRLLTINGVPVLRASLPAKTKLKSHHPFRSIQYPLSQIDHLHI